MNSFQYVLARIRGWIRRHVRRQDTGPYEALGARLPYATLDQDEEDRP